MRDEVMPAVVERPVRRERCRRCKQNCNRGDTVGCSQGNGLHSSQLDQPTDTESGTDRDGDKYGQVVRVLVFRDFVAEVVCQISDENKQQKPESCAVLPISSCETRKSKHQRQRQPRRAELAQEHPAKFNKLHSHYTRSKV